MKKKEKIEKTLEFYKTEIEKQGYDVYAVILKGSQNYGIDDENSDIDAEAILLPNLKSIVTRQKMTNKFVFDQGDVTAHDFFGFLEIAEKGNPNFLELIHSIYRIGGDLSFMNKMKINKQALIGMVYNDFNFLQRNTEKKNKIVSTIIREFEMIEKIKNNNNVLLNNDFFLVDKNIVDELKDIKRGKINFEEKYPLHLIEEKVKQYEKTLKNEEAFEQINTEDIELKIIDICTLHLIKNYKK